MQRAQVLASHGDHVTAEKVYETEMKGTLTHDEWEAARDGLCRSREARARMGLAGPAQTWTDPEITKLREEILRCPDLVALDNKLAAILVDRNLARLEALQPLVDREELWAALAAAAPIWAVLPPENPRIAWFAELRTRAAAQLTARAETWRDVPLARALLLELAWRASSDAGAGREPPVTVAEARILGRRAGGVTRVAPDCRGWFRAAGVPATPVDPADAVVELTVTDCTETLALVPAMEKYIDYEEREVKVTKYVPVQRTTSRPVTTSDRQCTSSWSSGGVPYQRCTTYLKTSYVTATESVMMPTTVLERQRVAVEKERPIKRLKRQIAVRASVRVTFVEGDRQAAVARDVNVIAGRYEVTTTTAQPGAGQFLGQDEQLASDLFAAAEAAAVVEVRARNVARYLAIAREARGRNDDRAAVDAYLTVRLTTPDEQGEGADFLGTALGVPAETFAPYAPPTAHAIEQRGHDVVAAAYQYFPPAALGNIQFGYAPLSLYGGVQGQRGPEIAGQPTRSGVRGIYEARLDVAGLMRKDKLGLGAYAPASFRLEIGKRTSETYIYPMTRGSSITEEGGWDAGIDTSVGLLVGHRSRRLGVFVGALASYQGHVLGGFRSSSGHLPLAAHLELRLRERYPIVLDVWGMELRDDDEFTRGARLDIPIGTGRWLSAAVRDTRARSQTRGLADDDIVDLGSRNLLSASLGLTFGF